MPNSLPLFLPAFFAFVAACTTPASPPAAPAAAREPVRSFSEIGFLRGRWTARMGLVTGFLLFEPDGSGGLMICEGATAISYARPVRHFLWRDDRIEVQDTSSTGPHMPGSWPLLRLGPEHVLIDGSPDEEWRRRRHASSRRDVSSARRTRPDGDTGLHAGSRRRSRGRSAQLPDVSRTFQAGLFFSPVSRRTSG